MAAVLAELQVRQAAAALDLIDETFPQQAAFVKDMQPFVAAKTTRRAGKSNGLGFKFFRAARKHPNVVLPYIALTRDSAKLIMWPILTEMNAKYRLGFREVESSLELVAPNKSVIKLFGADQKNFIARLRGIKTPLGAVDEGQSFRSHIEELVDDILTPAISDFEDGQVVLTGTPGPVPKGFFHDATKGVGGFSVHEWTVYQNPYMPRIKEFVANLMAKKKWTNQHPTYQREWLGQWVSDPDALVYKYAEARNRVPMLPATRDWTYVMGVDLGYSPDPTAFVICAFNQYDPNLYVVEVYKQAEMIISDVVERIKYYQKKYRGCFVVMDCADKQAVEEMRQRYSLPIIAAEKHGKAGFIELMNSDFHAGKIKLVGDDAAELAEEYAGLIWDSEKEKRVEDSRYPNHCADAALYAWRYCYNYLWTERPAEISPHSEQAIDEFWEQEERKLQNAKRNPLGF